MTLSSLLDWRQYYIRLLPLCIFFFVYSAVSELITRAYTGSSLSLIWPANGLALAILFLLGVELWPAIALGTLLIGTIHGIPLLVILGSTVGNTVQAVVGTVVLRRFDFDSLLGRLRDPVILIATAVMTTGIAPLFTIATLWAQNTLTSPFLLLWSAWWTSQMLSVLVVSSVIIRWARVMHKLTVPEWIETGLVFVVLISLEILVFWTPYSQAAGLPVFYLVLIPLIWIALRIGPRFMTLALLLTSLIALTGMAAVPMGPDTLSGYAFNVKLFLIVLSIVFLLFVSSEEGRKEAVKALEKHVGQLESALKKISAEDRAKNEFIAILAHELRNPLAPLVSSLEILKLEGGTTPEVHSLVKGMQEHVSTMARLLDDLLDISRISQKKFRLQKESVDLRSLVLRSIQSVEPLVQSRKHTLSVELPEHPIWLAADPVRLEQILINLLNNAAKYTEPGGKIFLSVRPEGHEVVMSVRDTGIGIEEDMLTRIFEPFMQVERGGRTAGLGIGLSLTKRLVEMHQGSIEAKSEGLGRGSEFTVHLPLTPKLQLPIPILRARRALRAQIGKGASQAKSYRILIVDDNEAAAQGLGKLLTYRGHQISLAYTGEAALEAAARLSPDIVILDIGLPGMDGYEVAQLLRESGTRNATLIALTGYGQEEDKHKAQEAGFNFHLTKPVGIAEVEAVLGRV